MKEQSKVMMPNYARTGYHSEHPVTRNQTDNKIRSEGGGMPGLTHTITKHGAPGKGYQPKDHEESMRPPRDNKISSMPPHQKDDFGIAENGRGKGAMRNTEDCYNQKPKMGGMPKHGMLNAKGTK